MIPAAPYQDKTYRCIGCGEALAAFAYTMGGRRYVHLDWRLRRMPDRDGVPVFGMPQRALRGRGESHGARNRSVVERAARGLRADDDAPGTVIPVEHALPALVYCPLAGVCGRLQRLL